MSEPRPTVTEAHRANARLLLLGVGATEDPRHVEMVALAILTRELAGCRAGLAGAAKACKANDPQANPGTDWPDSLWEEHAADVCARTCRGLAEKILKIDPAALLSPPTRKADA